MSLFIVICLSFINCGYAIPQIEFGSDGIMVLRNTLSMPPVADFAVEYDLKLRPGHSRLFIGAVCHEVTAERFKKTSEPDCSGKGIGVVEFTKMNEQLKVAYRAGIEIGTSEKKGSVWSDRENISKKKSRKKKKKAKKKKSKKKIKKKSKKLPDAVHVPPPHIHGFLKNAFSEIWPQELLEDYADAFDRFLSTYDGGVWNKVFEFVVEILGLKRAYATEDDAWMQREMTRVYDENHKDIEHFLDATTQKTWADWRRENWIHPRTGELPHPAAFQSPWYKVYGDVEGKLCTKTEDAFKKSDAYGTFLGQHPTWGDIYSRTVKSRDLIVKLKPIKSRIQFFLNSWDKSKREGLDLPILEAYKIAFGSFVKTESSEENFNFLLEVQQLFRDFGETIIPSKHSEGFHGDPQVLQRAMTQLFGKYGEEINIGYALKQQWMVASRTVNWEILRILYGTISKLILRNIKRFETSAEYHNYLRQYPEWTDIEWRDISGKGASASSAMSAHKLKSNVYVPYSENIGDMNDMNEMISVSRGYDSSILMLRYVVYGGILMIVAVAFCVIGTVFGVSVTCFFYENIKMDEKQVNVYGDRI